MLRSQYLLGSLLAAVVTAVGGDVSQAPGHSAPLPADSITVRAYFDGVVSLVTRDGQTRTVRLLRQQWAINGGQKLTRVPQPGFLVVQLGAGSLTTVIDGKRQERGEDEFWTIPVGSVMGVETGREQAVLEILAIADR